MREGFGGLSHWKPSREMELAQMGHADCEGQDQRSAVGNNIQAMGKTLKKPLRDHPNPFQKCIQATKTTWKCCGSLSWSGATQPRCS